MNACVICGSRSREALCVACDHVRLATIEALNDASNRLADCVVLAQRIPLERPAHNLAVLERLHRDLSALEKTRRRVNNLIMKAELRLGTIDTHQII